MRQWRPITWLVVGWVALFVLLGVAFRNPVGALQLFVPDGFVVFVLLLAIALVTRPKDRECPACGLAVRRGETQCGHCGFDFAASAAGGWRGSRH
jgi:hypothetical protein